MSDTRRRPNPKDYALRDRPDLGIRPGEKVVPHKHIDRSRPTTRQILHNHDEG